jgi:hypothetical protein
MPLLITLLLAAVVVTGVYWFGRWHGVKTHDKRHCARDQYNAGARETWERMLATLARHAADLERTAKQNQPANVDVAMPAPAPPKPRHRRPADVTTIDLGQRFLDADHNNKAWLYPEARQAASN